jgi:hypothetical protein
MPSNDHQSALEFITLDKERMWTVIRDRLVNKSKPLRVTDTFQELDLTKKGSWTSNWDFVDADVFMMSFVLSEVWCYNENNSITEFLQKIADKAKSGSLFVYLDNGGDDFSPLIESEYQDRKDLRIVFSEDDERMRISPHESRDVLEDAYMNKLDGARTKMGGNVAVRIWRKI